MSAANASATPTDAARSAWKSTTRSAGIAVGTVVRATIAAKATIEEKVTTGTGANSVLQSGKSGHGTYVRQQAAGGDRSNPTNEREPRQALGCAGYGRRIKLGIRKDFPANDLQH